VSDDTTDTVEPETTTTPGPLSVEDVFDQHFPDEGVRDEQPRDEQGRFAEVTPAETPTPEEPEAPAPSAETAAEQRRILKLKIDGNEEDFDLDAEYARDPEALAALIRQGKALPTVEERRRKEGMAEGAKTVADMLRAQGYELHYDQATGQLKATPPQRSAVTPVADLYAEEDAKIAALEQRIYETGDGAAVIELNRLTRAQNARRADETKTALSEYQAAQEKARTDAAQKALVEQFNKRVDGLVERRSQEFPAQSRKDLARFAWRVAVARGQFANSVEEVEAEVSEYFDRMRVFGATVTTNAAAPSNGQAARTAPIPSTGVPTPHAPAAPPPVGVGSPTPHSGALALNLKGKGLDDVSEEEWTQIFGS